MEANNRLSTRIFIEMSFNEAAFVLNVSPPRHAATTPCIFAAVERMG